MDHIQHFFEALYRDFNARRTDAVIACMTADVKWANGMDGGYVYGRDGVKEYWTRQFTMVSSDVTPLKIDEVNDVVKIQVHQVVHDLQGGLLADEIVFHFFRLEEDKIAEFSIGEKM